MMHKTSANGNISFKVIGIMLFLISGIYVIYSIRASISQTIYFRAKNNYSKNSDILSLCQRAQKLYPYNYRLLAWGAEETFDRSEDAIGLDKVNYLSLSETICDQGLSLNPHIMPLPFIKMQLLCRKSIKDGISYWEQYVEWDYWNSYNHAVLAVLYAASGKFGKAMQSLEFIKGTVDYEEAKQIVLDYWAADSAMPVIK